MDTELRKQVHMKMLSRSTNAKDAGHSTVVMLGYAVDIAMELIQQEVARAREQAIEDVKHAGYGYDDGTGFVLKISYKELAELKEKEE